MIALGAISSVCACTDSKRLLAAQTQAREVLSIVLGRSTPAAADANGAEPMEGVEGAAAAADKKSQVEKAEASLAQTQPTLAVVRASAATALAAAAVKAKQLADEEEREIQRLVLQARRLPSVDIICLSPLCASRLPWFEGFRSRAWRCELGGGVHATALLTNRSKQVVEQQQQKLDTKLKFLDDMDEVRPRSEAGTEKASTRMKRSPLTHRVRFCLLCAAVVAAPPERSGGA